MIIPETRGEPNINKDRLDVEVTWEGTIHPENRRVTGDPTLADLSRKRDDNGMVGNCRSIDNSHNQPDIKLGSVFPQCNPAWSNQFSSLKGFNVACLLAVASAGIVYSATAAVHGPVWCPESSAITRDNGGGVY